MIERAVNYGGCGRVEVLSSAHLFGEGAARSVNEARTNQAFLGLPFKDAVATFGARINQAGAGILGRQSRRRSRTASRDQTRRLLYSKLEEHQIQWTIKGLKMKKFGWRQSVVAQHSFCLCQRNLLCSARGASGNLLTLPQDEPNLESWMSVGYVTPHSNYVPRFIFSAWLPLKPPDNALWSENCLTQNRSMD